MRQKYFWIACGITTAVCLLVSLGGWIWMEKTLAVSSDSESIPMTEYIESPLTLLVTATDSTNTLRSVCLVRLIPEEQSVVVTPFPVQMLATASGRSGTLKALYSYGGQSAVQRGIASKIGITVNRYLRLDADAVTLLAAEVGGISYTVDEETAAASSLPAGEQTLDGRRLRILCSTLSPAAFLDVSESLYSSVCNKVLSLFATGKTQDIFSLLTEIAIDLNITAYDYTRYLPILTTIAATENAVQAVRTEGEWNKKETEYSLSENAAEYLSRAYG